MIDIPVTALFLRTIPDGILGMYAVYVFSCKSIHWTRLFLTGTVLGVSLFLVRLLPINFGIHTVLGLFIHIFLAYRFCRINIVRATTSSILYVILVLIGETLTLPVVSSATRIPLESMFDSAANILIFALPSLLFVFMVITLTYFVLHKISKYNRRWECEHN